MFADLNSPMVIREMKISKERFEGAVALRKSEIRDEIVRYQLRLTVVDAAGRAMEAMKAGLPRIEVAAWLAVAQCLVRGEWS